MTVKDFIKDQKQIMKMLITSLFTFGSAISAYSLFAFRVDQYGLYYKNADQIWLATGVGLMVLGWFIKNWKTV